MKKTKYLITAFACLAALFIAKAAEDVVVVKMNSGAQKIINVSDIENMAFEDAPEPVREVIKNVPVTHQKYYRGDTIFDDYFPEGATRDIVKSYRPDKPNTVTYTILDFLGTGSRSAESQNISIEVPDITNINQGWTPVEIPYQFSGLVLGEDSIYISRQGGIFYPECGKFDLVLSCFVRDTTYYDGYRQIGATNFLTQFDGYPDYQIDLTYEGLKKESDGKYYATVSGIPHSGVASMKFEARMGGNSDADYFVQEYTGGFPFIIKFPVTKDGRHYVLATAYSPEGKEALCAGLGFDVLLGYDPEADTDKAIASTLDILSRFSSLQSVYSEHFDFGYPGIMLGLDLQTADCASPNNGYNHFRYWSGFTSPSSAGAPAGMTWYTMYDQIEKCNKVTAIIKADDSDSKRQFLRAQALGVRAFDYFVLAQLFQFNYQLPGMPDKPCLPIVLESNQEAYRTEGAPRATVEAVYQQILSDINETIHLLENTDVTGSDILVSKNKRFISLASAYGLRARIYLTMGKYAEAENDARSAIAAFAGSPLSKTEAARPGFNSIDLNNWMWGIAINEGDRVVSSGIISWPSMVCTFSSNGYISVGSWKYCASDLYDRIPSNDVRKGWFLDRNFKSSNLNTEEKLYINDITNLEAYTNVKFAAYNNVVGQSVNANDIMLMRVEEMYYIMYEAMARNGNVAGAIDGFTQFIRSYRDSSYTLNASTAEEVAEAIFQDKRVEFWGEGLIWFDYMRLDKPIMRFDKNWPYEESFDIPSLSLDPSPDKPRAGIMIYCIPQREISENPQISDQDNNPACNRPQPGETF